jgi:hypothetical protein
MFSYSVAVALPEIYPQATSQKNKQQTNKQPNMHAMKSQ